MPAALALQPPPVNAHATPHAPARLRPLPPRLSGWRRIRRIAAITVVLSLVPAAISYVTTMSAPSNSTFVIRSIEWLRDQGAAQVASQVESLYYSLNAPSTGGAPLRRLPLRASGRSTTIEHPTNVAPVIRPALPGEGAWVPTESWSRQDPVQITQFRSDPLYPQMVAGIAWIDTTRARVVLYPGRQQPSVSMPRGAMEVPPSSRSRLLATFNSAFKLEDSRGGFAYAGHTYSPLTRGVATVIGYTDGRVDVQAWSGGPTAPPSVAFARQNLPLIVSGGHPNPNLGDGPAWGVTVGNAVRVWRSGLGVTARGNLIYAAAPDQTVASLAQILIRAGAVRAMELDINSYWVTFNSYSEGSANASTNLLPGMTRSADRYLTPDDRDFFAVYLR